MPILASVNDTGAESSSMVIGEMPTGVSGQQVFITGGAFTKSSLRSPLDLSFKTEIDSDTCALSIACTDLF